MRLPLILSSNRLKLAVTVISKAGAAIAGAFSAVIVAKVSGQEALGYFALLRVVPAVFVLFTEFGISNAYPYLIGRLKFNATAVYQNGIAAILCVTALQVILWVAFSGLIQEHFFSAYPPVWVFWIGVLAPFQVVQLHVVNVLRATGHIRQANSVFFTLEILILIFLMAGYEFDKFTIAYPLVVLVVAYCIVAVGGLAMLAIKGFWPKPVFDREIFRKGFEYGIKTQVGNAAQILNYRLDQLLVGAFLGVQELAIYAVASKGAELFRFFSTSITFVVEPMLATRASADAGSSVRQNYWRIFSANLLCVTVGIAMVPIALPLFFGRWSEASVTPFYILAIGMIVAGGNGLVSAYNFAIGAPNLNTRVIALGLFSTVALNAMLIPRLGMFGAAWATALTQLLVTVLYRLQFNATSMATVSSMNNR